MKFTSIALISALLYASPHYALAENTKGLRADTLFKDDASYWNRLLSKGYPVDSSMPTPPPTPRPTSAPVVPTYAPVVPTYAPVVIETPAPTTPAPLLAVSYGTTTT